MTNYVKAASCLTAAAIGLAAAGPASAGTAFLVQDGKPNAEIVVADSPPRATRLAAKELQDYVRKISGATLAVTNVPGAALVKIYVGQSAHTDKLGIKPYDIRDGGFRMVSGTNWLALIGRDDEFVPIEPFPSSRKDLTDGTLLEKWDKLTGNARWGNPVGSMFKNKSYFEVAPCAAASTNEQSNKDGAVQIWAFDERGSFNAVCGFLRSLGVRWYMPGEIGEVVPDMKSIPLPGVDETVRPAFPLRQFCIRFGTGGRDAALWSMRLGQREVYGTMIAHGMALFTGRKEFGNMHPDYFALRGGKRDNLRDDSKRQLCLSSEGLFKENVAFARATFDIYKYDVVSIMPPDGFSMCQCEKCAGKSTPERGSRGIVSDYVWDYVNRAAKETARTHPDRKILCCAYGAYTLPPLKIDKLNPNVVVMIVGGRRPTSSTPEQQEEIRQLREAWLKKTDNKIMIFENYPFTQRGFYLPAYVPRVIGGGINATKPYSAGEDIWFSPGKDFDAPGYNHFNLYFTARMYWEKDADALFNEYCRLFYGPAGDEMKAFFEYCEANHQELKDDLEKNRRALELFAAAGKKAGAGSVYGKRIALVADYLKALKNRGDQLARPRGPVPEQRMNDEAAGIKVDGRLDEPYWQNFPSFSGGRLKMMNKKQKSEKPAFGTNFKVAWGKENIYFAIICAESNACPLNIGTAKNDDPAIWQGDAVDILLETDEHSYYQIAVNPAGAVADLDRAAGKEDFSWSSMAEIAVSTNDSAWIIEARIPVVEDANDPLSQVVGRKPAFSLPWFFNICRRRVRENGTEFSAFSPAGLPEINDVMKFGKLIGKKKERKREPLFGTNAVTEAGGSSPAEPGLAGDGE